MRSSKGSSANNNGKKSEASTRGGAGGKARQLSTEELDQVAGGIAKVPSSTPPPVASPEPPTNWNAVAGFNTSHIALDAASMQSGKTEAEVAQAVGTGQATEAQAVHLLEALAQSDNTNPVQALLAFANDVVGQPGQAADAHLVGTQIAALIDPTISSMSAAQAAMQVVGTAVTSGQLSANNAVEVLAGIATGSGTLQVQAAAGAEIAGLVESNAIPASQAYSDMIGLAKSGDIAPDNLAGLFAGFGLAGNAAMQVVAGGEIAALIYGNILPMQVALSAVVDVMAETGDGFGLIANIAADGNPTFLVELGATIGSELAGAEHRPPLEIAEGIVSAFGANQVPATFTLAVLVGLSTDSAPFEQAAGIAIAQFIQNSGLGPQQTLADVSNLLASSPDDAFQLLLSIAAAGNATLQAAVGGQFVQLIDSNAGTEFSTVTQAISIINNRVFEGDLAPGIAVGLLLGMAAAGSGSVQVDVGDGLAALVGAKLPNLSAQQVSTDIETAVSSGLLTSAQAQEVILAWGSL